MLDKFLSADFSLFDSFCELTDKKIEFNHEGNMFYSFGHVGDFKIKASNANLIDVETFNKSFLHLIQYKLEFLSESPIIYLHYSAKNDPREFYVKRSNDLLKIALSLESQFEFFHVLKLEDSDYLFMETDYFPYHYHKSTTDLLAVNLRKILRENNLKTSRYLYKI